MPGSRVQYIALGAFLATMLVAIGVVIQRSDDTSSGRVEAQVPFGTTADGISATGVAMVPVDPDGSQSLNVIIDEESSSSDTQATLASVKAKIDAITAAAKGLGIAATDVVTTGVNVYPTGVYPPQPMSDGSVTMVPLDGTGDATPSRYHVNASLMIETGSTSQTAALSDAALRAGATSVNSMNGRGGRAAAPPDDTAIAAGIDTATKQAISLAQTSAKSADAKVGSLRAVSVAAPSPDYSGPGDVTRWAVYVTVTYDIAR